MALLGNTFAAGITFDVFPQRDVKRPYAKFQITAGSKSEYLALVKARKQDGRNRFTWNKGDYAAGQLADKATAGKVKVSGGYWPIVKAGAAARPEPTPTVVEPPVTPPTPAAPAGRPTIEGTSPRGGLTIMNADSVLAKVGKGITEFRNLFINGKLDLRGDEAAFFDCMFDGQSGQYCVECDDTKTNADARRFVRCEFLNADSCAIYGGAFTCSDSYVHDMDGDGFKATQDVVIEGCYVTRLGLGTGAHADGVQIRGGKRIKICRNFFNMPTNVPGTASNAALFCQMDGRGVSPRDIDFTENWCLGGNYTIRLLDSGPNCSATRNILYPGTPRYGFGTISDGDVWSGNVTNTGAAATPQMK